MLTDTTYLIDTNILTQEDENELLYWRDQFTNGYFAIGDTANRKIGELAGRQVPVARIYTAIGRIVGKAGRTVRYYAEIASFFDEKSRGQYSGCCFVHFAIAKQAGSKWQEVLDYASLYPQASEDDIRAKFLFISPESLKTSYYEVDQKYPESNQIEPPQPVTTPVFISKNYYTNRILTDISNSIDSIRRASDAMKCITGSESVVTMLDGTVNVLQAASKDALEVIGKLC